MDGALDLYAESDENFDDNFGQDGMGDANHNNNSVDLYDDVMGGEPSLASIQNKDRGGSGGTGGGGGGSNSGGGGGDGDHGDGDEHGYPQGGHGSSGSGGGGRKYSIILGNLTWWTSDDDLQEIMDSYGIQDLVDIRIHENRSNGQSKGFAIITVGSEESSRFLQQEIPKKEIQGQTAVAVPFSRQALNNFDAQSRKNESGGGRGNSGGPGMNQGSGDRGGSGNMNMRGGDRDRDRPQNNNMQNSMQQNRPRMPPRFPPGMPMAAMQRFPMGMNMAGAMGIPGMMPRFPGMRTPMSMMRPDRPVMGGMDWDSATAGAFGFPPGMGRMPGMGLPAPHVNPAFFGQFGAVAPQDFERSVDMTAAMNALTAGSDDYETLVAQMKQVSGNAISRAAAECKTDASGALAKLESALHIIRSSKVADDERVQRSIKSLQEAVEDMNSSKSGPETRNGDRHSRSPRERSRDRERDRERYREERDRDSDRGSRRERDREESPSRHRSRSKSRDRKRSSVDRSRDRERERERDRPRERNRERGDRRERESDRERDRRR